MKYFIAFLIVFLYSCSDVEVSKSPKMEVDSKLVFSDSDLMEIGDESKKKIKIVNTGKGELIIKKIELLQESDFKTGVYNASNKDSTDFPFKLRNNDFLEIEVKIKATEEGGKSTKMLIDSNDLKEPHKIIELIASNFKPILEIRFNGIESEDLVINKCNDIDLTKGTLIDLCNVGKSSLVIKDIELEGDNFKIEEINFPSKLKVSANIKSCVKNLSICHTGDSGEEGTIKIKTNENILHRIGLTGK